MPHQSGSTVYEWPVRVYWEDTDAGGVVYYANYLKFMERARTEWLRSKGIDQSVLADQTGAVMVVRRVECDYLSSARLDDELLVRVCLQRMRGASMEIAQTIVRKACETKLVDSLVKVACLDAQAWYPTKFPAVIADALAD